MLSSLRFGAFVLATADAAKPAKPAVANLLESATNMLKNGATGDVVDFAAETLAEVTGIVIPAILNESENDQKFLNSLHSQFQTIRDAVAQTNQEVFQLNAEEQAASSKHKGCRATQGDECTGKRECEMDLHHLWSKWVTEEEKLREIHATIDGHFCPPGSNGTLASFRAKVVGPMESWMAQKTVVDEAEVAYDNKVPDCIIEHAELDTQSSTCNADQTDLEQKACAHSLKINEVLHTYYEDQAQAQAHFNCAVEEIMELERDRKREWVTLQVVSCLLDKIHDQNGVPCDETTTTVTDEVGECEERHSISVCDPEEGEPKLCLEYLPVPPHPALCPAREEVLGECLPVAVPLPCDDQFIRDEYGALPVVPVGPFSEKNPGCNAYPVCIDCPPMETPAEKTIDTCPGYIMAGCPDEHGQEVAFVREAEGKADVRCCSMDGSTCGTTGFPGGIAIQDNDGGEYQGCLVDVTYQEAMTQCHARGMRICNADEMSVCCNTGCNHNTVAVWVDVSPEQAAVSPEQPAGPAPGPGPVPGPAPGPAL